MKRLNFVILVLSILVGQQALAQTQTGQKPLLSEKWENGIIELRDGKQLSGKLFYSFISEILILDDGLRRQGFNATQVAHFVQINDSSLQKTHYYSFPFDGQGSKKRPFSFYELVYQNGVVAIMSRHEYIYKEKNFGIADPMGMSFSQDQVATEKVKEIIYLTAAHSGIQKYGSTIKDRNSFIKPGYNSNTLYRDPRGPSLDGITTREPMQKYNVSKKILEALFSEKYDEVMEYIDAKKIKPNTIEEMTLMIDYYAQLVNKN